MLDEEKFYVCKRICQNWSTKLLLAFPLMKQEYVVLQFDINMYFCSYDRYVVLCIRCDWNRRIFLAFKVRHHCFEYPLLIGILQIICFNTLSATLILLKLYTERCVCKHYINTLVLFCFVIWCSDDWITRLILKNYDQLIIFRMSYESNSHFMCSRLCFS